MSAADQIEVVTVDEETPPKARSKLDQSDEGLKNGRSIRLKTKGSGHDYFLYLPASHQRTNRVLVLVHGKSGEAKELVKVFRPKADLYGTVLVVPVFDDETFPQYHQFGLNAPVGGERPDFALRQILDEVAEMAGVATDRFHIYGHSRGAQFAHRYAMIHPDSVLRCLVSSAGWYTLPSPKIPFPLGTKVSHRLRPLKLDLGQFLLMPVSVVVGALDTERDSNLKMSDRIDKAQGLTRLERARTWVDALTMAARDQGHPSNAKLHIIPDAGHDFTNLSARGLLDVAVAEHFFA